MSAPQVCPKCRTETLARPSAAVSRRKRPEGAEGGAKPVRPARCTSCHGLWLTRDELRRVEERVREEGAAALQIEEPGAAADRGGPGEEVDRRTGLCPDCGRILLRARVEGLQRSADAGDFFLDRCAHCGGIWFDAGEWNELGGEPVALELTRLWDPDWRQRQIEARNREASLRRLEQLLGSDLFASIEMMIEQLRAHPEKKGPALAYLDEELAVHVAPAAEEPGAPAE